MHDLFFNFFIIFQIRQTIDRWKKKPINEFILARGGVASKLIDSSVIVVGINIGDNGVPLSLCAVAS